MKKSYNKTNLVLACVSIFISLYCSEFVFLLIDNKLLTSTPTKIEVIEELRKNGIDAWPAVFPSIFIENKGIITHKGHVFPLSGISRKTTVLCRESGRVKVFISDEHGFNNPGGLYQKGKVKIAMIGDSFTIGACVDSGDDIASYLRNKGISVFNAGYSGIGPLIEFAIFKEYIEPLQPDIILWIYYEGNDLEDLRYERDVPILMQYLEDNYTQDLISRQDEIDTALTRYVSKLIDDESKRETAILGLTTRREKLDIKDLFINFMKLQHLRNRLSLLMTRDKQRLKVVIKDDIFNDEFPLFSKIITIVNHRVSGWGGRLYFVYLPTTARYPENADDNLFNRNEVITLINELHIRLIDFHEVLSKQQKPFVTVSDYPGGHYNAYGYRLVSELILRKLPTTLLH
ncbi:MAG: hypothetical protein QXT99_09850 [Candidatus Nitrosotenuis sp.]